MVENPCHLTVKRGNMFASGIVYSKPISTEGGPVLSRMTVEELNALMRREFPQSNSLLEEVGGGRARVRIPVDHNHLRPGGTVSGPAMMSLADTSMYLALLGEIGPVLLAVTTNLNIHFMRKPEADRDLIGECTIFKLGTKLAVGTMPSGSTSVETEASNTQSTSRAKGELGFPKIPIRGDFWRRMAGRSFNNSLVVPLLEIRILGSPEA